MRVRHMLVPCGTPRGDAIVGSACISYLDFCCVSTCERCVSMAVRPQQQLRRQKFVFCSVCTALHQFRGVGQRMTASTS